MDALRDKTQASELVNTVLKHVKCQLHLIHVFVESEHLVGASISFRRFSISSDELAFLDCTWSIKWRLTGIWCGPMARIRAVRRDSGLRFTAGSDILSVSIDAICIIVLGQMEWHLSLLTDLHEHELAHTDILFFAHLALTVKIYFVGSQRVENILESQVVTTTILFYLMEQDLEHFITKTNLARDLTRLTQRIDTRGLPGKLFCHGLCILGSWRVDEL